jgi:hypothetical protein
MIRVRITMNHPGGLIGSPHRKTKTLPTSCNQDTQRTPNLSLYFSAALVSFPRFHSLLHYVDDHRMPLDSQKFMSCYIDLRIRGPVDLEGLPLIRYDYASARIASLPFCPTIKVGRTGNPPGAMG